MPLLFVMIGGALGAGIRYQIGRVSLVLLGPGFPWGTWFINLSGGLFMGLLVGTLARHTPASGESWRLLLGVGVLGGYTTFSTFSLEAANMIQRSDWGTAALYMTSSAIGAVLLLFAGLWLARIGAHA
ncbi:fluoride efflux transporter CrcB [Sphingomonas sp. CGMCC 1.13654]|uniref:Fluoride-specific ion channel FluC n=1 Tax=Sphingomonas chungangi TaxID=2683589 RepID=A0A838L175_9SPHN|nr:fluoride efflux transporter CrcB [Sphingomonas chungangi]MBA2933101.1 fluoride efflux transporter CrcB [Sphingomonas chungangi]MVW56721.1 fluoride efflux transporter CrcB [Sphingomonas chungangi]